MRLVCCQEGLVVRAMDDGDRKGLPLYTTVSVDDSMFSLAPGQPPARLVPQFQRGSHWRAWCSARLSGRPYTHGAQYQKAAATMPT